MKLRVAIEVELQDVLNVKAEQKRRVSRAQANEDINA